MIEVECFTCDGSGFICDQCNDPWADCNCHEEDAGKHDCDVCGGSGYAPDSPDLPVGN